MAKLVIVGCAAIDRSLSSSWDCAAEANVQDRGLCNGVVSRDNRMRHRSWCNGWFAGGIRSCGKANENDVAPFHSFSGRSSYSSISSCLTRSQGQGL